MYNTPYQELLRKIPKLYETNNTMLEDKIVYAHFFFSTSDWYIFEYDGEDTFFGYAILNGDTQNAELGYISFSELRGLRVDGFEADYDLYWTEKKFSEAALEKGIRCAANSEPVQIL